MVCVNGMGRKGEGDASVCLAIHVPYITLRQSVRQEDISTDMFGKATDCVHESLFPLPATSPPQLLILPLAGVSFSSPCPRISAAVVSSLALRQQELQRRLFEAPLSCQPLIFSLTNIALSLVPFLAA